MATNERHMNVPTNGRMRSVAASVGGFLWHLLQMVIAMEVGMMIYHMLLWPLFAGTVIAAVTRAYPLVGYWMMVVSMALGMLALMYYHRSTGRYCLEMTIAMTAPVAALTVLVLCHLVPLQTLYGIGDPVMILAMAAYMLYRPHEHAHAHGAQEHAGH